MKILSSTYTQENTTHQEGVVRMARKSHSETDLLILQNKLCWANTKTISRN